MPQFFGQIDAVYSDFGGDFWAHPVGGAPGLPAGDFLHFGGLAGTQGAATFSAAVTHAKATGSNVWLFYTMSDRAVSSMYVSEEAVIVESPARPISATSEEIAAVRDGEWPENLRAMQEHPVPLTSDEIRQAREGTAPPSLASPPRGL
jgi:hypothetical protein